MVHSQIYGAVYAKQASWPEIDDFQAEKPECQQALVSSDLGKTISVHVSFTGDAGNEETLISAATAAVAARPNSPATGAPTITGTPEVGQELTADTSGITDADGLDSASFSYRWTANDTTTATDIEDAAESIYTLTDSDAGRMIQLRVSFTDDRGHAETLASASTAAVARPPLTVELESATTTPATHDGSNGFTFDMRFSEEPHPAFSYKTLRDHAFTVTGGTVKNARRLAKPSNIRWEITVSPSGNGDVVITLPVTQNCSSSGAICTSDGRKLSNRLELTVSGPGQSKPYIRRRATPALYGLVYQPVECLHIV